MENRMIDPAKIGMRLRLLRGIRSRATVARETGMSQSRLGNYEHGVRVPTDDAKVLLANYYGTTVQEIFFADNNNES